MRTERDCPVCGHPAASAPLFLEENFDASRLTALSFASRKEPEYMCHRLLRCPDCGLVYAVSPPTQQTLAAAYHDAGYDSAEEADDAADAYARAIAPLVSRLGTRDGVLDIGTGTGVFLERMRSMGFSRLVGVEPSAAAVAGAPPHRRAWIRNDIFRRPDFEPESFDLITCFMTLEHVPDPSAIAADALALLRPGGAFVTVTHDHRGRVNRLLGKRSPIIDIEHLQLFDGRSIGRLLVAAGFGSVAVAGFSNRYALRYWTRLAPLPRRLKRAALGVLGATGLGGVRLSFDVGNLMAHGLKPARPAR